MSLTEGNWRNQFTTPWTPVVKDRLRELWSSDLTISKIAAILHAEHGRLWSESSIGWKAEHMGLPPRGVPNSVWSKEMEDVLRAEWGNGTHSVTIADLLFKAFGVQFTKSAIIGKAHRLNLPRHTKANRTFQNPMERAAHRKARRTHWESTNRARRNENKRARYHALMQTRRAAPTVEDISIPTPQRKTIFELSKHDCRWPVGDPKSDLFFFCGAVAEDSRPYCPAHCGRAYVEIRAR